MSNDDIGKLTIHQFNKKVDFLNKLFSDKEEPTEKPSQNYGVLDKAWGKK